MSTSSAQAAFFCATRRRSRIGACGSAKWERKFRRAMIIAVIAVVFLIGLVVAVVIVARQPGRPEHDDNRSSRRRSTLSLPHKGTARGCFSRPGADGCLLRLAAPSGFWGPCPKKCAAWLGSSAPRFGVPLVRGSPRRHTMGTILHVNTIQANSIRRGQYVIDGRTLEGCSADVEPGVSIRIYGTYPNHVGGPKPFDKTFRLGDRCEYDSYNLKYTGSIVSIGPKTVVVRRQRHPPAADALRLYLAQLGLRRRCHRRAQRQREDGPVMGAILAIARSWSTSSAGFNNSTTAASHRTLLLCRAGSAAPRSRRAGASWPT